MDTEWLEMDYEDRTLLVDDEEMIDDEDETDEDETDEEIVDDDDDLDDSLNSEEFIEEAKELVRDAMMEFGVPAWVAHIPKQIRDLVPAGFVTEIRNNAPASEGWGKQSGGREAILAWAKNNIFAEVTVKSLAEIGKVSEATARTIINDRPDIFRRTEWGKYEVRDAQADRKADK